MASSWSDRGYPLKPDGTLDYAQLTVAEVCEDLTETLCDVVINGCEEALEPFLDDLPDSDDIISEARPSAKLVEFMETLHGLGESDITFRSQPARDAIRGAVRELRAASSV